MTGGRGSGARALVLLAGLWVLGVGGFAVAQPALLQASVAVSILQFSTMLMLVAVGQAFLILSGAGVDLSVGGMVSLSAILTMLAVRHGMPASLIPVVAVAIGAMLGAVNGLLVTGFGLLSLIATLGTMFAFGGLALALTGGATVAGVPDWLLPWGRGVVGGLPLPMLTIVLPVVVAGAAILGASSWGRWIMAMGGNERSARLIGLPVDRVRFLLYGASGGLAGAAALVSLGWLGRGRPDIGQNLELESLAAVLLGGVAIAGGRGNIVAVVLAVLLIVTIKTALQFVDVSSVWQLGIIGLLLILVLLADLVSLPLLVGRRSKLAMIERKP